VVGGTCSDWLMTYEGGSGMSPCICLLAIRMAVIARSRAITALSRCQSVQLCLQLGDLIGAVIALDFAPQRLGVHVCVDHRSAHVAVAQQCLHLADRQPTVERTGGVSVPEHVRMYTPVQPGLFSQRAHHRLHGAGRCALAIVANAAENGAPSILVLDSKTHKQQQDTPETVVVAFQAPTAQELNDRLAALGIARSTANKLIREYNAATIYRWLCYVEHRLQSGWIPKETPAAWLVSAIRSKDWVIPDWFQTPEEQEAGLKQKQREAKAEQESREAAAALERQTAEAQRLAIEQKLGIGEKSRTVWQKTLGLLQERGQMSPALLSTFLLPLEDSKATVATPVKFFSKVIVQNADIIQAALEEVIGKSIRGVEVKHLELEGTGSA
jgi:hypothetical protein